MEEASSSNHVEEEVITNRHKNYTVNRYKPKAEEATTSDDPVPDYMNLLAMIFSMCGLMLKIKWCAWCAVFCSLISFANSRSSEDGRQVLSSFI
ncbi:unnamed protein product [Clavelina lepadiformis]|uniref:PAT complex subunit Asterix n=1 Tax=Clavelina lepadiformis TaxID=159417 RepID=A0ABP0GE77_CLALP